MTRITLHKTVFLVAFTNILVQAQISSFPSCALSCYVKAVTDENCKAENSGFACPCKATTLAETLLPCAQDGCKGFERGAVEFEMAMRNLCISINTPIDPGDKPIIDSSRTTSPEIPASSARNTTIPFIVNPAERIDCFQEAMGAVACEGDDLRCLCQESTFFGNLLSCFTKLYQDTLGICIPFHQCVSEGFGIGPTEAFDCDPDPFNRVTFDQIEFSRDKVESGLHSASKANQCVQTRTSECLCRGNVLSQETAKLLEGSSCSAGQKSMTLQAIKDACQIGDVIQQADKHRFKFQIVSVAPTAWSTASSFDQTTLPIDTTSTPLARALPTGQSKFAGSMCNVRIGTAEPILADLTAQSLDRCHDLDTGADLAKELEVRDSGGGHRCLCNFWTKPGCGKPDGMGSHLTYILNEKLLLPDLGKISQIRPLPKDHHTYTLVDHGALSMILTWKIGLNSEPGYTKCELYSERSRGHGVAIRFSNRQEIQIVAMIGESSREQCNARFRSNYAYIYRLRV